MTEVRLQFGGQRLRLDEAERAGFRAYRYFASNTLPELSPLTYLSHAVRRYDDNHSLTAPMRHSLVREGFLDHGENVPIKRRLRLPGVVAVSLVIPELEYGKVAGESLQEPFQSIEVLQRWYEALKSKSLTQTRLSWIRD